MEDQGRDGQPIDAGQTSREEPHDSPPSTVNPSPAESTIASFISDHGSAGIAVWTATDRLMESTRNESGTGGCHICHENIVGEDARYYVSTAMASSRILGDSKRPLSITTVNYEVRYHILIRHMQSAPMPVHVESAWSEERPVRVEPAAPATVDYERVLRESEEMQVHILFLERELAFSRNALDRMYKAISNMPATAKPRQPFKSDVKVTCHSCGVKTYWRTGKGAGQCFPRCEEKDETRVTNRKIAIDAAFKVLFDEEED